MPLTATKPKEHISISYIIEEKNKIQISPHISLSEEKEDIWLYPIFPFFEGGDQEDLTDSWPVSWTWAIGGSLHSHLSLEYVFNPLFLY